jgi:hypothetical protein
MKKPLALLLAYMLIQAQTWALSGGPVYTNDQQSLTGTYAGVVVPTFESTTADPTVNPDDVFGANSLGVFTIGVPATGIAQGSIALFFEGSFFQGGVVGIADPGEGKIYGLAQLVRVTSKAVQGGDDGGISVGFDAKADGTIEAEVDVEQGGLRLSGSGVFELKIIDLTTLEFEDQGLIKVEIEGFRQSTQVTLPDQNSVADLLNQ